MSLTFSFPTIPGISKVTQCNIGHVMHCMHYKTNRDDDRIYVSHYV